MVVMIENDFVTKSGSSCVYKSERNFWFGYYIKRGAVKNTACSKILHFIDDQ
jgi:hypothetical protein